MIADKIKANIFFSVIEKGGILIAQFISSILLAKYLPVEEFGAIAVISGLFSFLQFFNIAFENILIRDYHLYKDSIEEGLSKFVTLNLLKSTIIGLVGISGGLVYYFLASSGQIAFLYVIFSLVLILIMDSLISPLIIYAGLVFKQSLVTKISLIRWTLNVAGLSVLIFSPSIKVVFLKDLFIFFVVIILWFRLAKKDLGICLKLSHFNLQSIKENIMGYSIWVHLLGVISTVIYKADATILYYFSTLAVVGKYNIALTLANVASIIPSVLIAQNNVVLSHCTTPEEAKRTTANFLRFSLYIGVLSFLGFVILGKTYLRIVTKDDIDEIYFYLLFIVSGLLIVKMIISPLFSFIQLKGKVKRLFFRVQVPMFLIALFNYALFSYLDGARGVAVSNLINGIVWLILIFIEIKSYGFKISDIGSSKDDYNQVKNYVNKYFSKI